MSGFRFSHPAKTPAGTFKQGGDLVDGYPIAEIGKMYEIVIVALFRRT